MLTDMTRSRVIQVWFATVALIVVASLALGASVTISTGALLVALCLVPPAIIMKLWPGRQPQTVGEVLATPNGVERARGSAAPQTSIVDRTKEDRMMNRRTLAAGTLGLALLTQPVDGEGLARYRTFEFGMNVGAVSALTGVVAAEVKTVHQRPALLQDLQWRLSQWVAGSCRRFDGSRRTDRFQLLQRSPVPDCGRLRSQPNRRHDGPDITDAISAVYGVPAKRVAGPVRAASRVEVESGTRVAQWRDADNTVILYRTSSYRGAFRLIVTDSALDTLAQKATLQAIRLDDQEAPRREIARQKKDADDTRAAAEKARLTNKSGFRP